MSRIAVITGGSSGIGMALVQEFARHGFLVFELSRSGLSYETVHHIDTDVSDPKSIQSAFAQIHRQTDHIDVLVNNAGMGISGAVEYTDYADAHKLFDVNFFGTVASVQCALPLLKKGYGRIVNVSSAAAVLPVPFQAYYSASKAAINAYSLALANEIGRFGVGVCIVMPGDAKTAFTDKRNKSDLGDEAYKGAIGRSVSLMEKDEQHGMSATYVANKIYHIATKKRAKTIATIGIKYQLFAVLSKFLPTGLVNRLIGSIYAK